MTEDTRKFALTRRGILQRTAAAGVAGAAGGVAIGRMGGAEADSLGRECERLWRRQSLLVTTDHHQHE